MSIHAGKPFARVLSILFGLLLLIEHRLPAANPGLSQSSSIDITQNNYMDGVIKGLGTKDSPFKIMANYFYYNLSPDQEVGFKNAIDSYNNNGKPFAVAVDADTFYVQFALRAMHVSGKREAKAKIEECTIRDDRMSIYYGSSVTNGVAKAANELGGSDNKSILLDGKSVANWEEVKSGRKTAVDVFMAVAIHEIGHSLGGNHGDPGHIMVNQTQFLSYVDEDGIRAILGRVDENYYIQSSLYLTREEMKHVKIRNSGIRKEKGTNGRIIPLAPNDKPHYVL